MTHLKKSLAMLLALIMMFSSMSVAATAANSSEDPSDITFTVKFFREDPENPGTWIETKNAAPGENVKARVYVETGYYTTGGDSCFLFDKTFFSLVGFEDNVKRSITVNTQYAGASDDDYGAGEYALEGEGAWKANFSEWYNNKHMDFIVNEIEEDADFFETHDIISHNISFGSAVKNCRLVADDWMYEFDFTVNDDTLTNTVDSIGEAKVPPYYYSADRTVINNKGKEVGAELFIDIPKGEAGENKDANIGMWEWIPEFNTNPATITTTSEIIFDMGLVDANGAWEENTYTTEKGIISKEANLNAIANPTHPDGKVFAYWSATQPAEGVTQEKVSTISYDYDAQTLYAVWTDAPDVSYTLKEFYMNADGSYPEDVEGVTREAAPNSTVSAPAPTDSRYSLDTEMSDFDVVVKADNSSVVNAYYKRNTYKLVYHYEDNAGAQTDSYNVRFGAPLHTFGATASGEPTKTGYTFLGWTTTEGGTTAETLPNAMPAEELHLYPVYEPHIIDFIFKSGEGTFADESTIKRYSFNYSSSTTGTAFEEPTALGKKFVGWDDDIPETATENKEFEAIYEPELYTVTFMADTDEDGTYETTVSTKEFEYGEKLYTEFAPENYPADAWVFEDGTSFVFSDVEDEAYAVTGDLTLYTVGADEYPARFYWSEEDLENGAEPYTTTYVKFDESIPAPEAPEKAGYSFIAWTPDVGSGLIMDSTDGLDFVAIFEANTITVTFDPDEGTCDVTSDSAKYGESIEALPAPSRDGYKFLGWFAPDGTNAGLAGEPYEVPTEDITLTARWEKVVSKSIITLDANGGKFSNGAPVYSISGEVGDQLNAVPSNPTRDGYEFIGWVDENGNATSIPEYVPAEDVTLKANWEIKEYTITFNTDGGNDIEAKTYDFGATIGELPVPEKDGFEFAGWIWTNEDGETIAECDTMPAYNVTVTATWTPVEISSHTVEYYLAVDGALYETLTFEEGETIVHPDDPTVEGLTFKGWVDADGNALPEEMVMGTEDIKVYAKFDFNSYKVTYIVDGEVYEEYDDVLYQSEVPVPEDPADSEYRLFAGWQPAVESTMPAHDLTYTATWADPEPDKFTATFLRADGKTHAKYVLAEGDEIPVPEAPQKFGYVFTGWEPEVPDTMPAEDMVFEPQYEIDKTFVTIVIGGTVVAGGVIAGSIIGANIAAITGISIVGGILAIVGVAELVKNTHTVTYIVDGEVYKTYKVVEGTKIPVPADPVKDGFTFDGWNPEVPEKMGETDLVFEATWAEKSDDDSADVDVEIPETGSVAGGLAAFAVISGAAAAAYVITKRKKED